MRVVAVLAVVVLVGCGGSRRELRQAATPAGTPTPATGTPTVGDYTPVGTGLGPDRMPGQPRVTLPRNRNSAKPTKAEDTVYAADSTPRKGYYPYEVEAQFPEFRGDLRDLPKRCAALMTEAIRKAVPGIDKRDVDSIDGLCLDARLFVMCVSKETKGRRDDVAVEAREKADTAMLDACDSRKNDTPYVRRLVEATRKVYE